MHGNQYERVARTRRAHRQLGASLLEGIAYLGIAAIVVIGAVALLNTAFSSANANQLNQELSAIQTAVRKLYMTTAGSYGSGSVNLALASAGGFPQTLTVNTSTGAVTNAWGGSVTVTGGATSFTVAYTQVPTNVCVNALTSTTSGWTSVLVTGGTSRTPPISPANAQTDCSGSNSNTITWTSN